MGHCAETSCRTETDKEAMRMRWLKWTLRSGDGSSRNFSLRADLEDKEQISAMASRQKILVE